MSFTLFYMPTLSCWINKWSRFASSLWQVRHYKICSFSYTAWRVFKSSVEQYIKSLLNRGMHEEVCFFDLFLSLTYLNVLMSRKLVLSQSNWKELPLKLKESSRKWNLSENYWKNSVRPLHVQSSCSTPFHVWHCKVASETSCLLALFTSCIQTIF